MFSKLRSRDMKGGYLAKIIYLRGYISNKIIIALKLKCIPHRDINVVVQLEFLQAGEGVQGGDILHLVVREVQGAQAGQGQAPGQLVQHVPAQVPRLQRLEPRQQLHREVLTFQPQAGETVEGRAIQETRSLWFSKKEKVPIISNETLYSHHV